MSAENWTRIESFSEIPIWIVFDELVMMLVAFPDGRLSKMLIGWAKRLRR